MQPAFRQQYERADRGNGKNTTWSPPDRRPRSKSSNNPEHGVESPITTVPIEPTRTDDVLSSTIAAESTAKTHSRIRQEHVERLREMSWCYSFERFSNVKVRHRQQCGWICNSRRFTQWESSADQPASISAIIRQKALAVAREKLATSTVSAPKRNP